MFRCFILKQFLFGFFTFRGSGLPQAYNKWSPVYPTLVRHWQASKGLNKSIIILGNLELPVLYQSMLSVVIRILIILRAHNHPVALWEADLSLLKEYEGSLGYAEGSPLTLLNHFI